MDCIDFRKLLFQDYFIIGWDDAAFLDLEPARCIESCGFDIFSGSTSCSRRVGEDLEIAVSIPHGGIKTNVESTTSIWCITGCNAVIQNNCCSGGWFLAKDTISE